MACDSSTKEWYAKRGMKQRTLTVSNGEVEVRSFDTLPIDASRCWCTLRYNAPAHGTVVDRFPFEFLGIFRGFQGLGTMRIAF